MKAPILKYAALALLAVLLAASCTSRTETEAGTASDIENPPTSQDSVTSYKNDVPPGDTAALKKVDATRMSDGKDAAKGEVTPPEAQEQ